MPLRLISDDILLPHDLIEFIQRSKKGRKSFFALKLDMSRAYEGISWDFLVAVSRAMGFSHMWIDLVYQCITTDFFLFWSMEVNLCALNLRAG